MIIFSLPVYDKLAGQLARKARARRGAFTAARFADNELWLSLKAKVKNQDCVIIGSFTPPDEQILTTLLLADTLKRNGAKKITLILPFMSYARQDKDRPGHSRAAAWLARLIAASGVDRVAAVDVHSERVPTMLPGKFTNISVLSLFAEVIKKNQLERATIVSPDEGALGRAKQLAQLLGVSASRVAYFRKKRTARGVTLSKVRGQVSEHAIILDDMLDTGGTLVSCCEKLRASGVKKITIMVTHGLFTGTAWRWLWKLGVENIYCTDSLAPKRGESKRVKRIEIVDNIFDIVYH